MRKIFVFPPVLALFLSACSAIGTLTEGDREKLTSVGFLPTTVRAGAYEYPDGMKSPEFQKQFGAIGWYIDAAAVAPQQEAFVENDGRYFGTVEAGMPKTLSDMVTDKVREVVGENTFFKGKLVEKSDNNFQARILEYGLVRTYKLDDMTLLSFRISVELTLYESPDDEVFSGVVSGVSTEAHTMKTYAENTALITSAANKAVASMGKELAKYLDSKTETKTFDSY